MARLRAATFVRVAFLLAGVRLARLRAGAADLRAVFLAPAPAARFVARDFFDDAELRFVVLMSASDGIRRDGRMFDSKLPLYAG
ncbi:MAG TPA: hypothetical protein VHE32_05830 [Rhodanobacteraceae bacterium]|nr:hypothetical protein [Rhodanobacteraceae bacterium]